MELRKEKEIEYYDSQMEKHSEAEEEKDFEGFNPLLLKSFQFCYRWLEQNSRGKMLLDYGCGNGIHSTWPAKNGAVVVGIDLSEKSLDVAKTRAQREELEDKTRFFKMDCEKTGFKDDSFDIVFDGGTFSSLDLKKALPELARILKPDGFLLGIETFGHNPLTNLKRRLNKVTGKRTEWAVSHIFRLEDLQEAKKYFDKTEIIFFHLTSWIIFPFLKIPGSKFFLNLFEAVDKVLLKIPFLRKYSFKVVFIFSHPHTKQEQSAGGGKIGEASSCYGVGARPKKRYGKKIV